MVPEALFDPAQLKTLLKADPLANGESSTYYLAILQNLFFASLNVEMGADRKWAADGGGMKGDRLIHSLYRHTELFHDPDQALKEIFSKTPFLNGGLFECLDRELSEADFQRNPELKSLATKEGNGYVLRVDGFSRRKDAQPKVPNKLFFGGETQADLNADLGTKGKRVDVHGLLDIFARYKFTVEEEVALDPELLGKVFENLLASYNADTQATARKQSGSFYTPREVVDYMVDEALIAYFERALLPSPASDLTHGNVGLRDETANPSDNTAPGECELPPVGRVSPSGRNPTNDDSTHSNVGLRDETANPSDNFDSKLRSLLSYRSENSGFSLDETSRLITAIEQLKILDPACGSGAYPMGVLNKLVHILRKLDPDNQGWKAQNRASLTAQLAEAKKIRDPSLHESRLEEAENALAKFDRDFPNAQHADYPRKLYLIEKCIHGVDIQPIAVQIAKLRDTLADELEHSGFSTAKAQQLVHWNLFDQNAAADFFDPEWIFQLADGFDVVIGNPPYVRQEEIKPLKNGLKAHYDCYTGTADLYVYFYERSIKLLKAHGAFAFITANKWYRAKYGEKLRDWMNAHTRLRRIIDFGDAAVFTAIAYPTIVIATRRPLPLCPSPASRRLGEAEGVNSEEVLVLNWTQQHPVEQFPQIFAQDAFTVPQAELSRNGWQLEPPLKRRLLERIRAAGKPLGEYVNGRFYYGIKTGFNEAFVIDGATRARLIGEDPKSAEIIKPFLRGRDVKRWRVEPKDLWLIFTRRPFAIEQYPAILAHLTQFKTQLMPKPDDWDDKRDGTWPGRKAGSYQWYEIQDNIAYWQ